MARIKPKNSIKNRQQAEDAMSRINSIDRLFAEWDMAEAGAVARVREEHADIRKKGNYVGLESERALLIKELQAWAEVDCTSWEKKTLQTPFGCIGFRISNPAVVLVKKIAKNLDAALDWLRDMDLEKYIRTKKEIDKEAILTDFKNQNLNEALLEKCGLAIKQSDEFWVESAASKDLEEAAKKLKAA